MHAWSARISRGRCDIVLYINLYSWYLPRVITYMRVSILRRKNRVFFFKVTCPSLDFFSDQHKSKTGVSWVRVRNSLGHLSAGVRYVLIHFDVIGHCPKSMNLYLGSNIECIPMVNINLIEPVVKCSNVQPLGTFSRVWNKMNETPKPWFQFPQLLRDIDIQEDISCACTEYGEARHMQKFGQSTTCDMRRCCPK